MTASCYRRSAVHSLCNRLEEARRLAAGAADADDTDARPRLARAARAAPACAGRLAGRVHEDVALVELVDVGLREISTRNWGPRYRSKSDSFGVLCVYVGKAKTRADAWLVQQHTSSCFRILSWRSLRSFLPARREIRTLEDQQSSKASKQTLQQSCNSTCSRIAACQSILPSVSSFVWWVPAGTLGSRAPTSPSDR